MKSIHALLLATLAYGLSSITLAAEYSRHHVSIEVQYVEQENYRDSSGDKFSLGGTLTARTIQLDWYYDLNDRW